MANDLPDHCPSASEIESLAGGEEVSVAVRAHVERCETCRRAIEEIRDNEQFLRMAGEQLRQAVGASRVAARLGAAAHGGEAALAENAALVPGFVVFEEISRGGQGAVFRAVQIATKRPAAIKMLLGGDLASSRQRARFEREIEIAAALRHPNVVTVFESGRTPAGYPYVAMEYIQGAALDQYVQRTFPEPNQRSKHQVDAIVRILAAVASGVGTAHTSGVIHRDLKPSNILVDTHGVPRVLDFGLARPAVEAMDATRTQEFVGSPAYAAPEQFTGVGMVDARTDVYSLGVVLYSLLSGKLPYPSGSTFSEVARHVVETPPAPLSRVAARISKDLETIVAKCLAKDPARRYSSAAALEADLHHYLRNEAIDARRDSAWYMLKMAANQNRRLLAAAAVVVSIIGVNAYLLVDQVFAVRAARGKAELEQQRAEFEAIRSEGIGEVLRVIVPQGDWYSGRERSPFAREIYERFSQFQTKVDYGAFAARPELELTIRSTLAAVYANSPHLLATGEIAIREALTSRRTAFGEEHLETATGYHELAEVLLLRKRYPEAESAAQKAMRIRVNLLGPQSHLVGRSCEQIARISIETRNLADAVAFSERANAILERSTDAPRDRAAALRTLAEVRALVGDPDADTSAILALRFALGELSDDDALLVSCLACAIRVNNGLVADIESAYGMTRSDLESLHVRLRSGDRTNGYRDTLSVLLRVRRALLPEGHPAIHRNLTAVAVQAFSEAIVVMQSGEVYRGRTMIKSAILCLKEAIPLIESDLGPDTIAASNVCEEIAQYSVRIGEFDQAIEFAERFWRIARAQPHSTVDRFSVALTARWYGWFLCLAGEAVAAEAVSREAVERFRKILPPEHHSLAFAQAQVAWSMVQQERASEALDIARASYEMAVRSPATPPDQRAFIGCVLGLTMMANDHCFEGANLIDESAAFYWPQRTYFPIHSFLRAARNGLVQAGDEAALADFNGRWQETLADWDD